MKNQKKVRLSICIDPYHHKKLKLCCVNLGVSITDFVLKSIDNSIDNSIEEKGKYGIDNKENL